MSGMKRVVKRTIHMLGGWTSNCKIYVYSTLHTWEKESLPLTLQEVDRQSVASSGLESVENGMILEKSPH